MFVAFSAEPVPLSQEDNGDIHVGDSRVLLDLVVHAETLGEFRYG